MQTLWFSAIGPIPIWNYVLEAHRQALYGVGWQSAAFSDGMSYTDLSVSRCLFKDFMARHNEPDLVGIFCAAHARLLLSDTERLRNRQVSSMPKGNDECLFHYEAMEPIEDEQSVYSTVQT
jgi:hypothetical protein